MYLADLVKETTTTTGTGTVTLAGAVSGYQTFASRVKVGDPCSYKIRASNGDFESGEGTLQSSTTLSRDSIQESSNSDAAITLPSGTHTIELTFNADRANKLTVFGDGFIDHVVSGLLLPSTSANLTGSMSAGIAYVIGQRVVKGAQANTYTASKDTYVDLSNTGVLTYSAVNNGAGAPALTANSIRLGKVVTGGSTITSATTTGKDSLGNWMRNLVRVPTCNLLSTTPVTEPNSTATAQAFGSGTTVFDNDGMHSEVTNNTRITIAHAGMYAAYSSIQCNSVGSSKSIYLQINKNGSLDPNFGLGGVATQSGFEMCGRSGIDYCAAGDYLEFVITTSASFDLTNLNFSVVRVG